MEPRTSPRILIFSEDPSLLLAFEPLSAPARQTAAADELLAWLADSPAAWVVVDLSGLAHRALDLARMVRARRPDARLIVALPGPDFGRLVEALRAGAQDALVKPIRPRDWAEALLRGGLGPRAVREAPAAYSAVAVYDSPEPAAPLSGSERALAWGGQVVYLTPTEAVLIQALRQARGQPLAYSGLAQRVYGYEIDTGESARVLRPLVSRLRRKLRALEGGEHWVRSVRGLGYRWAGP